MYPKPYTVLSIDPGIEHLGVCVTEYDLETKVPELVFVQTFHGGQLVKDLDDLILRYGHRGAKLLRLSTELEKVMLEYVPDIVAIEYPFLGRFPQAFGALMECITMVRSVSYSCCSSASYVCIDPPTIKNAVGVPGTSSDKEDMRKAVGKIYSTQLVEELELSLLDEHSIDAIALGYMITDDMSKDPTLVPGYVRAVAVKKVRLRASGKPVGAPLKKRKRRRRRRKKR